MRTLFTITIFLSSLLLFLIEPMIAKMILPRFGGSPGVWNSSMLFFQIALLAGYGYAHLTTKVIKPRFQSVAHIVVLLLPLLFLPIALPNGIQLTGSNPAPLVLLILAISVGAPFLIVSAGAPLLQRWFAATNDPHAHDPYFLYSASNLGSMIALLAYPFLIEPRFSLTDQSRFWSYGYYGLVILMAVCAALLWVGGARIPGAVHEAPILLPPEGEEPPTVNHEAISWKRRLLWIALAFCPSSLLLGVTTYITSNVAPMPLLWVIPLALYLLTFIVAFARKQTLSLPLLTRAVPLVVVPLAFTMVLEATDASIIIPLIIFHLLAFFAVSLLCHTRLANDRPKAEHLTEFFFFVSLGGVLGGLFNALIAPTIFNSYFEYPLILAVACLFRPFRGDQKPERMDWIYALGFGVVTTAIILVAKGAWPNPTTLRSGITIGIPLILVFLASDRPLRFAYTLILFFGLESFFQISVQGFVIEAKRSFFGVHRIVADQNQYGIFHTLVHGNTVHGKENFGTDPTEAGVALTYYYSSGPIGKLFQVLGPSRRSVAVVGLGVGSLAYYGRAGQKFTYYEIDPDVAALATNPKLFTFVPNCKADLKIDLGDARLEIAKAPANAYDLIVLDAFSSDAIPMHLLTREAIQIYLSKLMPGGVIAFHISNRYLDLKPILANEAAAFELTAWYQDDQEPDYDRGKYPSIWIIVARSESDFGELRRRDPGWEPVGPDPTAPLWTDDYSNIASVLRMFRKSGE